MLWLHLSYGQSLSNMLRLIFMVIVTIIGLCAVICTAEPIFRHHSQSLIDVNAVTIDCAGNHADSPECRSQSVEKNGTSSTTSQNKGNVGEIEKSWSLEDIFSNGEVEEARGKKKKGMGKIFILMAAAAKAKLMWIMIHAVAILAAKAFVVAKIALALAAAIALKKSLEHHDKSTYEIVKHPQYSHVNTHSSSVDYDHHGGYEGQRRRRRFARRS